MLSTADLQSIKNIFAAVVPETSTAGLVFLRDAKHSGFLDHLSANYQGLYATDQLDLTSRWKLRIGGRQDWWRTKLAPRINVAGRRAIGQLIEPPNTYTRNDTPFSWNVGTVYRILPGVSPFLWSSTQQPYQRSAPKLPREWCAGARIAAHTVRELA